MIFTVSPKKAIFMRLKFPGLVIRRNHACNSTLLSPVYHMPRFLYSIAEER
jgi:hypothetical protein